MSTALNMGSSLDLNHETITATGTTDFDNEDFELTQALALSHIAVEKPAETELTIDAIYPGDGATVRLVTSGTTDADGEPLTSAIYLGGEGLEFPTGTILRTNSTNSADGTKKVTPVVKRPA